jgi:hypothetical protein
MDVEFAFICEGADFGSRGPSAIGIGRHLVPIGSTRLPLVAQLRFKGSQTGSHRLELLIYDPDGSIVERETQEIYLPPVEEDAFVPYGHIPFVVEYRGVNFRKRGPHAVHILADNNLRGVVPFEVI